MPTLPDVRLERIPDVGELQRICDEFFAQAPIETSYSVIAGDDEGNQITGDYSERPVEEQMQLHAASLRYMWLSAARKRLARND